MTTRAELEEFVADCLDGSLPEARRRKLQTHLDDCAGYRNFISGYPMTVRVTKKVFENKSATAETPENLVQAILASLER